MAAGMAAGTASGTAAATAAGMAANTSSQESYLIIMVSRGRTIRSFISQILNSPDSEDTDRNTDERVCADRASFVTCTTGSLMGGCSVPVARDICQASCGTCE